VLSLTKFDYFWGCLDGWKSERKVTNIITNYATGIYIKQGEGNDQLYVEVLRYPTENIE